MENNKKNFVRKWKKMEYKTHFKTFKKQKILTLKKCVIHSSIFSESVRNGYPKFEGKNSNVKIEKRGIFGVLEKICVLKIHLS